MKVNIPKNLYASFELGGNTDRDVIARAVGYGYDIAGSCVVIEHTYKGFEIEMHFLPTGDQKISYEEDEFTEEENRVLELVRDHSLREKADQELFAKLLDDVDRTVDLFALNCWYEGVIIIKRDGQEIVNEYESSVGLEGVHDSVKGIIDHYDEKALNETIEYVMQREDGKCVHCGKEDCYLHCDESQYS